MGERIKDFNDLAVKYGPEKAGRAVGEWLALTEESQKLSRFESFGSIDVCRLIEENPHLKEPVIEGLVRRGESFTLVSGAKKKKSWLRDHLCLSIASNQEWLGFCCPQRRPTVLIIDNELDPALLAFRIKEVGGKMGIDYNRIRRQFHYYCVRGKNKDINDIHNEITSRLEPGDVDFVVIDALYRMFPQGMRENDNSDVARVFNKIDAIAMHLDAAVMVVHHATKGSQIGKAVTDVGSGGGAMTRSVSSHMILRDHADPSGNMVIMEGVTRSFTDVDPRVLEWDFPRYIYREDMPIAYQNGAEDDGYIKKQKGPMWHLDANKSFEEKCKEFVDTFFPETGDKPRNEIEFEAQRLNIPKAHVKSYLQSAEGREMIVQTSGPRAKGGYRYAKAGAVNVKQEKQGKQKKVKRKKMGKENLF